ncbi:MAG: PAS domain S-box protein, partial [Verrucomicrobiaceae bacterium]
RTAIPDDEVLWRKDGTNFPAEYWSYPAVVLEGEVALSVVTFLDITERRRAEEELRKFKFLTDNANDSLLLIDAEARIVYANRFACEHRGYPENCLQGVTIPEIDPLYPLPKFKELFSRAKRERIPTFESIHKKADGTEFPVEISVTLVELDGHPYLFADSRDITERRRAEAALRESEEQHRAVLATLKEGVILHDAYGGVIMANASAESILGLTLGQMYGRDSFDPRWRTLAEDGSGLAGDRHPAQIALRTERPVTDGIMNVCRPDGSRVWISVNAIPLRDPHGDQITGVVTSFFDITARKAAQEERERLLASERLAREAAETANAAKDRFLAVLSHELRNPLAPVLASATLMLQDERLPDDLLEEANTIHRNAQLEARLIDDLLDLSRVSKGKMHMEMRPVQINALIAHSLQICEPEIEAKKLNVTSTLMATNSTIMGDPARLQQVLWNLLRNAIKFSNPASTMSVATKNDASGALEISVTDEGIGIEPEDLDRIFRPFEQAVRTSQFGGLGLGLTISRTLVEMHQGTLQVESAGRGRGATFILSFPTLPDQVANSAHNGQSYLAEPEPVSAGLRVLLVEDQADAARTMAKLLTRRGHTVHTTATVAEALEVATVHDLDVVISDIGLGEQSGHDLMRALQVRKPGLPGIALSGYGMESDVTHSLEAGFTLHLTKPVEPATLYEALNKVTRRTSPQENG